MASNSEENSSSDCSFGWVSMKDKETEIKKKSAVQARVMSSDSEDSDATEFDEGGDSDNAVNRIQEQHLEPERNVSSTINEPFRPTGDLSSELDVSRNENSMGGLADNSQYEEHNSNEEEGSSEEEEEEEDKKVLKPFMKKLAIKLEKIPHTLSDDDNVARTSMRVKSESKRPVQEHKINKSGALIQGVLIDSSQTLPFDIDVNEEVWFVQCPREISASTLKGKTLNFKGVSQLDQFESNVLTTPENQSVNLLLPKIPGKVINVVPSGHIVFKEKETVPQAIHPIHKEENIISLPTGLKLRHPLFGTELPLLKAPFGVSQRKKKKKKKNKHLDASVGDEYSATEYGMTGADNIADVSKQLSPSHVHMKAKNKKKLGEHCNQLEKEMLVRDSEGINSISSKKIKKYQAEDADGYDMGGSFVDTSLVLDDDKIKKKKKKKHKVEKEYESEDVKPVINQTPDENYEYSTPLLTQRLHKSSDESLTFNSSGIFKKKKKKKKKQNYNELSNFSSETADNSFVPSHKKSKKVKSQLVDSGRHLEQTVKTRKVEKINSDNLHCLDQEMEEVSIKKRKKSSLSQTTKDNSNHTFNRTILDQEAEYFDETPVKKKKKKKSE